MNIECENCGGEIERFGSWRAFLKASSASLRCPYCKQLVREDVYRVQGALLKSIVLATVVAVVPILFIMLICSAGSGFCVELEYLMRGKTSALLSVLLLLNFVLMFLGLAVPEIIRSCSGER